MNKKNTIFICYSGFLLFVLFFSSCKTVPKFSGESDFCGLVIDENDNPVEGAFVSMKKGGIVKNTYTNNRGIFVIDDIQSGIYDFEFEKTGYEITTVENVLFSDIKKVFCFKINSKERIFSEIEYLFSNQQYEKAFFVIEKLKTEKKSNLYNLCCLYKSYGYYKMENKRAAKVEIGKIKKNCCFDFSELKNRLEDK